MEPRYREAPNIALKIWKTNIEKRTLEVKLDCRLWTTVANYRKGELVCDKQFLEGKLRVAQAQCQSSLVKNGRMVQEETNQRRESKVNEEKYVEKSANKMVDMKFFDIIVSKDRDDYETY